MTIDHSTSDIVPSVSLGGNIDQYAISTEPTGCILSTHTTLATEQIAPADADDLLIQQSTYNIDNSNDVVIGPVTHFHCPVTIIQKAQAQDFNKPKLPDDDNISSQQHEQRTPNKLSTNQAPRESRSMRQKYLALLKQYKTRRKVLHVILFVTTLIAFTFAAAIAVVFTRDTTEDMVYRNGTNEIDYNDTIIPVDFEADSQVIPRSFWGARPPLSIRVLETPVQYIIVAHTAGNPCMNVSTCGPILQTLQSLAVDQNSPDIGYNFLIGGDGNIYVGRGWDAINYLQNHCISVAIMGNYVYDDFTPKMQRALQDVIRMGVMMDKIVRHYTLLSHSQTGDTMSPGTKVRTVIEKWPNYYQQDYIEIPN